MGRKTIEINKAGGRFPRMIYGLQGISALFNVSKSTAQKMSRGIIKDACTKNGGVIIVNTRKALELFGCQHPEDFIEQ